MLDRKTYQQSLPTKRVSAGCLLFDENGRLLVVNPTYKKTWEIPGGVVEMNESPMSAVVRETAEELGLDLQPVRLLAVDYSGETETRTESLQFIFLGPVLTDALIRKIRLPLAELSEYRLLAPHDAVQLLNKKLGSRVTHCLELLANDCTHYLEEQSPVFVWE